MTIIKAYIFVSMVSLLLAENIIRAVRTASISLMYELGQGTVTYASAWNVTGGTIELSIEKAGYSDGVVIIRYRDSQNVETKIQKDLEDI
mgnify:CR=1 FL=1